MGEATATTEGTRGTVVAVGFESCVIELTNRNERIDVTDEITESIANGGE